MAIMHPGLRISMISLAGDIRIPGYLQAGAGDNIRALDRNRAHPRGGRIGCALPRAIRP